MSDDLVGIDDDADELEHGGSEKGDGAGTEHFCPECGDGFDSKAKLGLHRFRKHGVRGSSDSSKRRRGGTDKTPARKQQPKAAGRPQRARLVETGLKEFADMADGLRGRFALDDLSIADTIRRDADKMGEALASLAERFGFLGLLIDVVFGPAGPLGLFVAFGPTLRKTVASGRDRRSARDEARLNALQAEYEQVLAEQGVVAAQEWAEHHGLEVAGA